MQTCECAATATSTMQLPLQFHLHLLRIAPGGRGQSIGDQLHWGDNAIRPSGPKPETQERSRALGRPCPHMAKRFDYAERVDKALDAEHAFNFGAEKVHSDDSSACLTPQKVGLLRGRPQFVSTVFIAHVKLLYSLIKAKPR